MLQAIAATGLAAVGFAVGGVALARLAVDQPLAAPGAIAIARPAAVAYAVLLAGTVRVVRRFDPPVTEYGPGHLGVDLGSSRAAPVRAAGSGVVRFAGSVAGRGVVVVLHADGVSTEYEPVRVLVRVGQRVSRGAAIGQVSGRHRGCPGWCLHWGARRGDTYVDPTSLLRPLGPVRLLPWRPDG